MLGGCVVKMEGVVDGRGACVNVRKGKLNIEELRKISER